MEMMLSKWIAAPLVLLLGVVLWVSYGMGYDQYSYWLIPVVVALAVLYVMHPEIDGWYVKNHPQRLPKGMVRFIEDHLPVTALMDTAQRADFEKATFTYLKSTTFMPQGFEQVPEDLKVVVAASGFALTAFRSEWHKKIMAFENIVIYRHPFPSPQYPKYLHSSEMYIKDQVILLCADHFMKAFRYPQQYFNTAMYEWAKVIFLDEKPEFEINLEALPQISGFENEVIVDYIGLPESYVHWEAVATTYFFIFPVRYKMHMDTSYERISKFFGVDPVALIGAKS